MYVAKEKGSKVVKKLVDGGQDVILPSYQAAVEVVEFLKNCGNNPLDLPWGGDHKCLLPFLESHGVLPEFKEIVSSMFSRLFRSR